MSWVAGFLWYWRDFVTIVEQGTREGGYGAYEDAQLAAAFRHWADAGNGTYFDAQGAAALNEAMAHALRPRFEIVDAQGGVVAEGLAGGEPVRVMPGNYTVRLAGHGGASHSLSVRAKEKVTVRL